MKTRLPTPNYGIQRTANSLWRLNIGVRVNEAHSPDVRRLHLGRIRYWVYYRVQQNRLKVLSVWQSNRDSSPAV